MITRGVREIENEIAAGTFVWDSSLEDFPMNIEAALTKRIGPAGAKLDTGRSRNDQIALDLRPYVREEIDEIDREAIAKRSASSVSPKTASNAFSEDVLKVVDVRKAL